MKFPVFRRLTVFIGHSIGNFFIARLMQTNGDRCSRSHVKDFFEKREIESTNFHFFWSSFNLRRCPLETVFFVTDRTGWRQNGFEISRVSEDSRLLLRSVSFGRVSDGNSEGINWHCGSELSSARRPFNCHPSKPFVLIFKRRHVE